MFGLKAMLLRFAGAKIGRNVRVCSSVTILGWGRLEIGDDTWVGPMTFVFCGASVSIGKCVDIGPQVYIGTGSHQIDKLGPHSAGLGFNKDIVIEDGAWLGAGAMILPGVVIGRKTVVAAGAVVIESARERMVIAGVPAREIRPI